MPYALGSHRMSKGLGFFFKRHVMLTTLAACIASACTLLAMFVSHPGSDAHVLAVCNSKCDLHISEQCCLCPPSNTYIRPLCFSSGVWQVCCGRDSNRVFVLHGRLQSGQQCRTGSSGSAVIGVEPIVHCGNRDPSHQKWSRKGPANAVFDEQQGTYNCKDVAKPIIVWFT